MNNEVNNNSNDNLNVKANSYSKLIIVILSILLISAIGFICYDKFINTEKPPVPTPVPSSDVDENKITSFKKVTITDNDQIINIGEKEFKIKKETTIDGSFLLINNTIQYVDDMETAYADFAYVTNKYIIFTIIGQDGELISYAINNDGKRINTNDNKYQMQDIKNVDGTIVARGHIFCGLDGDCPDIELLVKYENNTITVLPKNNN